MRPPSPGASQRDWRRSSMPGAAGRRSVQMDVTIVDGTCADSRRSAVSALTLAFVRDPVMRWTYPEPESWQETVGAIFEKMDAFHPEEPHWYLAIVGVDAAHQGQGLGAKLLQAALGRCDREGLIAYLESSNPANIPLYERHGFRVIGEIREGNAPVITPMLRPAA